MDRLFTQQLTDTLRHVLAIQPKTMVNGYSWKKFSHNPARMRIRGGPPSLFIAWQAFVFQSLASWMFIEEPCPVNEAAPTKPVAGMTHGQLPDTSNRRFSATEARIAPEEVRGSCAMLINSKAAMACSALVRKLCEPIRFETPFSICFGSRPDH